MLLTYYGHSALQIETDDVTVLVDPFITGNPHAEGIVTAEDLEPDVILLTHAHGDHWGDTPSIAKRTDALVVGAYEIAQYLGREHGHENAFGMNVGGSYAFDWGRVTQTLAWHSSSFPDGTYGGQPNGYILHMDGLCLYLAGDTALHAEMAWIGEEHAVDVAFLPIGDCFTMGPDDAVKAAGMVGAEVTVPMHYNTFPPIEVDVDAWVDQMSEAGHEAHVIHPGGTMNL